MTNLQVKYNSDKSRDFTRPDLPNQGGGGNDIGSGAGLMDTPMLGRGMQFKICLSF